MSLSGDLYTMGLVDVLTWIDDRRKTGTLHLQRRSTRKRIVFREGGIYSSWSNDPRGLESLEPPARQIAEMAASGRSLAEISLETRRSEYETGLALFRLCEDGVLEVLQADEESTATDVVGAIEELVRLGDQRLAERRYDAAVEAYEEALALDRLNHAAKKGLVAVAQGRERDRLARRVPVDKVPFLLMGSVALTRERFDAQEGFVLSRVNGQWNVQSILKLCPMPEEDALSIFVRLLDRKVIELR